MFRQDGNQGVTQNGGDENSFLLFLDSLHKPCGYQLFQNPGTGGWGSQSLALGILRHILNPCPLHGGQQRVLRKGLGRLGLAVLDGNSIRGKGLSGGQPRKPFAAFLFGGIPFPAEILGHFQMELEVGPAAGDHCVCLLVAVGAGGGNHHLTGNELEDILLSHGQCLQILPAGGLGGDNGMVVRDLFGITELFPIDFIRNGQIADARGPQKNLFHTGQHIVRQIPAVRSGVGTELLFIECLQIVKCLLSRIPQQTVGIPLQAGQVIQRRGSFFLFLLTNLFDNGGVCCLAGCRKSFRLRFCGKAVTDRMELSQSQVNGIIAFRGKGGNSTLPLYQQDQRRRHDRADIQLGLVGQTEKPTGVDTHQPVRLGTAKGTLV